MVSKFQWKPFWLATQRDPQNDWTATQNRVNYDVFAQAPLALVKGVIRKRFFRFPVHNPRSSGHSPFQLFPSPAGSIRSRNLPCMDALHAKRLTRSLPRAVYIRRQNDHPGGQGRIYTSHLNFVFTHLSKPGNRRGCRCMSPRCLLRQFVDRCLLFWAFFIEKTVLLCFARFLSKWRETALWLFPDATSWYELYV